MRETRLNELILLYVHRDISLDHDKVIDRFIRQNRRLKFRWWKLAMFYVVHVSCSCMSRRAPLPVPVQMHYGSDARFSTPKLITTINLRHDGGSCEPPLQFLAKLIIHLFRICCENFRPRSRKVRSPGHVKWPHLIKKFECSSQLHRLNDCL